MVQPLRFYFLSLLLGTRRIHKFTRFLWVCRVRKPEHAVMFDVTRKYASFNFLGLVMHMNALAYASSVSICRISE